MNNSSFYTGYKKQELFSNYASPSTNQVSYNRNSSIWYSIRKYLISKVNSFWIQLCYFLTLSLVGYLALSVTKPRSSASPRPKSLDVFFTSVSATTVSSMSTVEMEVFSNAQLVIMTILMLLGGEVFVSLLVLHLVNKYSSFPKNQSIHNQNLVNQLVELGSVSYLAQDQNLNPNTSLENNNNNKSSSSDDEILKHKSIRCLCYVGLAFFMVVHIVGSCLVSMYTSLLPSARQVLEKKGLQILTFSVFTTVSTFSNCGFIPTNENMIVFKENSGLLLLLIPQTLLGNTLYPPCLRFVIWFLKKITKRVEFEYILSNSREMGYSHLLPSLHSCLLGVTVLGFICVQFVLFCCLEWSSEPMDGLSFYQKIVASLFQIVGSRHSGESVFDLSIISPAMLVLFVVMMYLPPHTSFLPSRNFEKDSRNGKTKKEHEKKTLMEYLLFSQLSYLVIFVILVCITERERMKEDPLNFTVLNITVEIISAYGNVGFTTGYSCQRRLKHENSCEDRWYGFVGRWSNKGKLILILVMFFGRLKKFNMKGGKAWRLL